MATKIRLQRQGRKARAIYHLVVTDSRVKRDGKYVERLGLINPNTNPRTIDVDFEAAVRWVKNGAEMSDTARTILSDLGVLLRKHLDGGVTKGALTQEQADSKFDAWKKERESKLNKSVESDSAAKQAELKKRFDAETKVKEARAAEQAKKLQEASAPVAEVASEESSEEDTQIAE
jgi:small subunit ribosomal protein S16